jgi:hypothetical protein
VLQALLKAKYIIKVFLYHIDLCNLMENS